MSEFIYTTEIYKNTVNEYVENNGYEDVSTHMKNLLVSVMMTRDGILKGGSFVSAVVNNDLKGAFRCGDDESIKHLKLLVNICDNCYVE
jgi:hypothetical protein